MSDLGYAGLMAVCWLDFKRKEYAQTDTITILPRGKMGFPPTSNHGTIKYYDRKMSLKFNYSLPKRHLTIDVPEFDWKGEKLNLTANLTLHQEPDLESMAIATSWEENRKAFYYNQKINCMPVKGRVTLGDKDGPTRIDGIGDQHQDTWMVNLLVGILAMDSQIEHRHQKI